MAKGALKRFGSNYSYAISGVAGPKGGTLEKPVGTVWFALANEKESKAWLLCLHGSRQAIIHATVNRVLAQLWMFSQGK